MTPRVAMATAAAAAVVLTCQLMTIVDAARRHQKPEVGGLRLSVSPRQAVVEPDARTTIVCRAKVSGTSADDLQFGFYMFLGDDTSLPLSSHSRGVTIQRPRRNSALKGRQIGQQQRKKQQQQQERPDESSTNRTRNSSKSRQRARRVSSWTDSRLLVLDHDFFLFLHRGATKFCCTASITMLTFSEQTASGNVTSNEVIRQPIRRESMIRQTSNSTFTLHKDW